jgi:hypothetical protein
MVERHSETMPEDVRQAFADAIWLYNHWRFEPPNVPAPTLGFRTLKVSLSGICDLVAAYKNEPLPLPVHDELWRLIDEIKLKRSLRWILPTPPVRDVWTCADIAEYDA